MNASFHIERQVCLGPGATPIPERLLLAQARGEVLFLVGAGVSRAAGLPDYRELVLRVYERVDPVTCRVLAGQPCGDPGPSGALAGRQQLRPEQLAEVDRFAKGEYDVVLGMLERRMDEADRRNSAVRKAIADALRQQPRPAPIHRHLMRLADRGAAAAIVTTNFDLLLEKAGRSLGRGSRTHALGTMPRPSRNEEFSGVLHIHGALSAKAGSSSSLVATDQDFGEFYLRRSVVPDFVHDAARLYHLVLVGYSANDPPMRYLLDAVAADAPRFRDVHERFAFVATGARPDAAGLADWQSRGITPIAYLEADDHAQLAATLSRWSALAPTSARPNTVEAEVRRCVRRPWAHAPQDTRDLFDHLVRRSSPDERRHIASAASAAGADMGWLDAILAVAREPQRGHA